MVRSGAIALLTLGADRLLIASSRAALVLGLHIAATQVTQVIAVVVSINARGGLAAHAEVLTVLGRGAIGVSHGGEHRIIGSGTLGSRQVDDRTTLGGRPAGKGVVIVVIQVLLGGEGAGGNLAVEHLSGGGHALDAPSDLDGIRQSARLTGDPVIVLRAVGEHRTGLGTGGIQHAAVTVPQLSRGQGDAVVQGEAALRIVLGRLLESIILSLIVLIDDQIGTGATVHSNHAGALGGNDLSATADNGEILIEEILPNYRAVQEAVANHNTVDVKDHVLEVRHGALLALAGGIGSRYKLLAGIDEIQALFIRAGLEIQTAGPVLAVKEDQRVTGTHHRAGRIGRTDLQNRLGTHGQGGAGQHSNILHQGGGAAPDGDIDVVGDGQHKVAGIHRVAGQRHRNGGQSTIAIGIQVQGIGGRIVLFHDLAVHTGLEHSTLTDELDGGCGDALRGQEEAGGHVGGGTVVVGGGHLHVLHVVLGHGEHHQIAGQSQSGVTAAQVGDLEHLVDTGAIVGGDGTVAVDVTPSIQIAVDLDVGAGGHIDIAQSVGGGSGTTRSSGRVTAAHLQRTVDGDGGIRRHGQGAVGIGLGPLDLSAIGAGAGRRSAVGGVRIIIGDQQSDTGGNHVIAGDGAIVQQNDGLIGFAGRSGGSGIAQVIVLGRTHAEQSDIIGQENGINLGIRRSHQFKLGILGQILFALGVVPAVEDITVLSRGRQLHLGTQGHLFYHLGGDRSAVQGVGTTLGGRLEGQDRIRYRQANQSQIGDGEGALERSATGRLQLDGDALTGSQSLGERAGGAGLVADGNSTGQAGTGGGSGTAGGQRPIKAQYRLGTRIIGQGQVRGVGFSRSTLAGGRNAGATGSPGGGAAALVGILPRRGQTGHGGTQGVRREYGGNHRCQHSQS